MAVRRPEYRCLEGPRRSVGSISPSLLLFVQTGDPTKQNGGIGSQARGEAITSSHAVCGPAPAELAERSSDCVRDAIRPQADRRERAALRLGFETRSARS